MAEQKMAEASKLCTNCKKQISQPTYDLHTIHCHRRIQLCPKCNEPYPKEELQQHIDENHHMVKCDWCSSAIDASKLDAHKQSCRKRPEECPYCQLDTASDELGVHIDVCGTRTEQCKRCGTYVKLMELQDHDEEQCKRSVRQKIRKDAEDMEKSYAAALSYVKQPTLQLGSGWSPQRPSLNGYGLTAPTTSSFDARPGPSYTIFEPRTNSSRKPEERERKLTAEEPTTVSKRPNSVEIRGNPGAKEEAQPEVDPDSIPCEFCNVLFPSDVYIDHVRYCDSNANRFNYGLTELTVPLNRGTYDGQADHPITISDDEAASVASEAEEDVVGVTNKYTEAVDDRYRDAEPATTKLKHDENAEAAAAANYSEELVDMLPCQFCNKLIPYPEFIGHQSHCERHSTVGLYQTSHSKVHPQQRGALGYAYDEPIAAENQTPISLSDDEVTQEEKFPPLNTTKWQDEAARSIAYRGQDEHEGQGYDDEDGVLIPCQFCQKMLGCIDIQNHQELCERRFDIPRDNFSFLPSTTQTPSSYDSLHTPRRSHFLQPSGVTDLGRTEQSSVSSYGLPSASRSSAWERTAGNRYISPKEDVKNYTTVAHHSLVDPRLKSTPASSSNASLQPYSKKTSIGAGQASKNSDLTVQGSSAFSSHHQTKSNYDYSTNTPAVNDRATGATKPNNMNANSTRSPNNLSHQSRWN